MIIRKRSQFDELCQAVVEQQNVIVDTETTGLRVWYGDRLCGVGVALDLGRFYYLPFRHKVFNDSMTLLKLLEDSYTDYNLPMGWIGDLWHALQQVPKLTGHNIKFDLAVMAQDGYVVPPDQEIEETMCGARLYLPERVGGKGGMSLEALTYELLGQDQSEWKAKFKAYLKGRKIEKHYDQAQVEVMAEYNGGDVINTMRVRDRLKAYAEETEQLDVYETEQRVIRVLWDMERDGMFVDQGYIQWAIGECSAARDHIMSYMYQYAGREFNPWSNDDVTNAMVECGIRPWRMTEAGNPSWDEVALQKIDHPLAPMILNWRHVDKMINTYFEPYSHVEGGWVHCNFKSWVPITGRMSCEDPNLQQVQRLTEWEIEGLPDFDVQVRRMFTPPPGFRLVCMDYKQMEMVGFSDYLEDQKLRARLNSEDIDFHNFVTTMIFKMDESHPKFKQQRQIAKAISLGLVYGMGVEKLARAIDESEDVARAYRRKYFEAFPTAPSFIDRVFRTVEERGFVFNRFGRRYYLHPQLAYKAINYLVQGTCADIIKRVMIEIRNTCKAGGYRSRLAAQMHDEFILYIAEDEFKEVVPKVQELMEHPYLKTRMPVDISVGQPSWGDKVKLCKACFEVKLEDHICQG